MSTTTDLIERSERLADIVERCERLQKLGLVRLCEFKGSRHVYVPSGPKGYIRTVWEYPKRLREGDYANYGSDWSEPHNEVDLPTQTYLLCGWFESSDYSQGRAIQESNRRAFLKRHVVDDLDDGFPDGFHDVYGGHSTIGLAVRVDVLTSDMLDDIEGLEDYPIIDEQEMSEYEMEQQSEAWECWVSHDFQREIEQRLDIDIKDTGDIWCDWISLFHKAAEQANEYWFEDGCDQYIRVDKVAAEVELSDLDQHGVKYEVESD